MTTICCVCKKTKNKNRWKLQDITENILISHGYCPVCFKDTLRKIEQMYPAR